MRALSRIATALATLVLVGVATGATGPTDHQVALTTTGPQPAAVGVAWGDSVVFTNTAGAAVRFAIPKLNVATDIAAGGTLSQKFVLRRGSYRFTQRIGNEMHSGTVTVDVAGAVTVKAVPADVPFGKPVALTGTSPYGAAPVDVTMREAQGALKTLATLTTQTDGSFSTRVTVPRGGRIVVTAAAGQLRSNRVTLTVVPRVVVTAKPQRTKPGTFVKVRAVFRPAGAAARAFLDVYETARNRWQPNKSAAVNKAGVVAFGLRVAKGKTQMRIRVPASGRRAGYADVTTKPVAVVAK